MKKLSLSGRRTHTEENVDFRSDILPVTCGEMKGYLIKRKLERGGTVKFIRGEDGKWFTPREFEVAGGYENSSNWKLSVRCGGRTLKTLMEEGYLPVPPKTHNRKNEEENSYICEVCQDAGKLFCCGTCSKYFHEKCHIPPVKTESKSWSCTFCMMKKYSRSQECHRESEVLKRQMGPEEQLKCEFLLMELYRHLEGSKFKKIPHDNYIEVASQCLKELDMLANIKRKLNERSYPQVKGCVREVIQIFQSNTQSTNHNDSDQPQEKFKKNFKEIFSVQ
ncbi:PREDICTED: nuclear body protein SP140-like protein [Hipposideros armiger]|uniref:Nuclear body protein SP140-like protein n=1 Tax=Hipposideros armiger TaxID=186990 RepID=A0A8B7Q538_HIPAR|nr:PREDICTED: nuclear body protein SP140-like protein [Hipposideros armiger]